MSLTLQRMQSGAEILRERSSVTYNDAEQAFSFFIQGKLYRLLRGEDNDFMLMRRYLQSASRLAFLMPRGLDGAQLRTDVAEQIIASVLRFLDPFAPGGPISQKTDGSQVTETQTFPTQYPHIVVERVDVFDLPTRDGVYIEWRAVRLQNQRQSTLINRALDLGNLALELTKLRGS